MTQVLTVHPTHPDPASIAVASQAILEGKLVAFPTETVYGLGANARNADAVGRIFTAKGRPTDDPLIVHLPSAEELEQVAIEIPGVVDNLATVFWPGPLTLVLRRHPSIPANVSAGLDTVAVRVPAHPVAEALLRSSGVPIAAPSANLFGHSSPTTAAHVLDDLDGRIEYILDGGPTRVGVESTVLDLTHGTPQILRPGGITFEFLQAVLGTVLLPPVVDLPTQGPQVSPGLLDKHYAPRASLVFFMFDDPEKLAKEIELIARQAMDSGKKTGLLIADEDRDRFAFLDTTQVTIGSLNDLDTVASRLYSGIRVLDEKGVDIILARDFGEQGIGRAIRDRLMRAATRIISQG